MKVEIEADEWFPHYSMTTDESFFYLSARYHYDVPPEFVELYDRVASEYMTLQRILGEIDDKRNGYAPPIPNAKRAWEA